MRIFVNPGREFRKYLALIAIAQGLGYIYTCVIGARLTTTYLIMAERMPLWAFGAIFILVGLAMRLTIDRRRGAAGRAASGALAVLYVFMVSIYMLSGAYGAALRDSIIIIAALNEALYKDYI